MENTHQLDFSKKIKIHQQIDDT